ncbi:MAG: response regulator [Bdellovibrionota bacterium]
MKTLIVEPDPNRQRQLRTILSSLGHKSGEIETVADAKTAINTLRKKRFDCVFVSMAPPIEALPLVKEMRGGSGAKSLPIIVYSSEVTKENVIAAAEAGANTFLAYPFSVSDVENVIKQAFQKVG